MVTSRREPVIYVVTTEDDAGYTEESHHLTYAGAQAARRHVLVGELAQRAIHASEGQVPLAELQQLEAEILALDEDTFRTRAEEAGPSFSVLEHLLHEWPAESIWPGHTVTILPSPPKGDN